MCGRYSLSSTRLTLQQRFQLTNPPRLQPRFNIAPTQPAPVIRADEEGGRSLKPMRWGLIPPWAKEAAMGAKMINARSETAAEKPSFRRALKRQRCLVPMDGFFEWRRGRQKTPYYIHSSKGDVLAAAGLWESWLDPAGRTVESYAILTTGANALMEGLHDRMPVFLQDGDWKRWLDASLQDTAALADLLAPCDPDLLKMHEVSPAVGKVGNDSAELIEPAGGQGQLF